MLWDPGQWSSPEAELISAISSLAIASSFPEDLSLPWSVEQPGELSMSVSSAVDELSPFLLPISVAGELPHDVSVVDELSPLLSMEVDLISSSLSVVDELSPQHLLCFV